MAPTRSRPTPPSSDRPVGIRPAGNDPRPARDFAVRATESHESAPPRPVRGSVTELLPAPPSRPPAVEPLFDPLRQRAVLSTLATTRPPGRDIAVDELVERFARREPITRVPTRPTPTTRLGVCVLVDHGPAMAPFRQDLRLLVAALRQVGGRDAVEAFAFRRSLGTVTALSEPDGERPYTPTGGPRLLAATDLGIGMPGTAIRPADWLALAGTARAAGSPLVVLCPYPPARWPWWAAGLTVVHWDRPTSARDVQRALRSRR
jgi:hypothetical protein